MQYIESNATYNFTQNGINFEVVTVSRTQLAVDFVVRILKPDGTKEEMCVGRDSVFTAEIKKYDGVEEFMVMVGPFQGITVETVIKARAFFTSASTRDVSGKHNVSWHPTYSTTTMLEDSEKFTNWESADLVRSKIQQNPSEYGLEKWQAKQLEIEARPGKFQNSKLAWVLSTGNQPYEIGAKTWDSVYVAKNKVGNSCVSSS